MRYAVLRRWKDNEADFEVVEYFATKEECASFIKQQKKSNRFEWMVGEYS